MKAETGNVRQAAKAVPMETNDKSLARQIRQCIEKGCEQLFNVKCDWKQVLLCSHFADAAIRPSYTSQIRAETACELINRERDSFLLFDTVLIESAVFSADFINIMFTKEALTVLVKKSVELFPEAYFLEKVSTDFEYSIVRAHMLRNKSGCFADYLGIRSWRSAFCAALLLTGQACAAKKEIAAKYFLEAEKSASDLNGVGKLADAISRLLYYAYTSDKN